jgi:polyhydroxyalkanoate synthesis regulator phasin
MDEMITQAKIDEKLLELKKELILKFTFDDAQLVKRIEKLENEIKKLKDIINKLKNKNKLI